MSSQLEPPTFYSPTRKLPHMIEFDTTSGIQTYTDVGKQFEVNYRNYSATEAPVA